MISAIFRSDETDPSPKGKLIILVRIGRSTSIRTLRKEVGIGSSLHDVVFDCITVFLTSSGVVGLSVSNGGGGSQSSWSRGTW